MLKSNEWLTDGLGPLCRRPPVRVVLGEALPGPKGGDDHLVDGQLVDGAVLMSVGRDGRGRQQRQQRADSDAHVDSSPAAWVLRVRVRASCRPRSSARSPPTHRDRPAAERHSRSLSRRRRRNLLSLSHSLTLENLQLLWWCGARTDD